MDSRNKFILGKSKTKYLFIFSKIKNIHLKHLEQIQIIFSKFVDGCPANKT